jgi:hypothetical protein
MMHWLSGSVSRFSIIALYLVGTAMGCVEKPVRPEPNVAPAAVLEWEPGERYAYRLSMTTRTVLGPEDPLNLTLEGDLELYARKKGAAKRELLPRLLRARLSSGATQPNPELERVARELSEPFVLVLDAGKLAELHLPKDASPLAVGVRRTLAAALQFPSARPEAAITVSEFDASGEYQAEYRPGSTPSAYSKKKLRYSRMLAADHTGAQKVSLGILPRVVASETKFEIDKGVLRTLHQKDELTTELKAGSLELGGKTELTLSLGEKRSAPLPESFEAVVARSTRVGADQPSATAGLTRTLEQARISGMTVQSAIAQLEEAERKRNVKSKEAQKDYLDRNSAPFTALAALIRTEPNGVRDVSAKIRTGSVAKGVLLDALSTAGTDTAQAALMSFVTDKKLDDALRGKAATSLIRTEHPSVATIDALIGLLNDPLLSNHALYGLGTASRRLREAGSVELSRRAFDAVLERLTAAKTGAEKVHVLRGIANSGEVAALPDVRRLLKDPNAGVHAAAIEALRLMQHDSVDALIVEALASSTETTTRSAALNAMQARVPSKVLSSGLSQFVRTTSDPYARLRAVELAAKWLRTSSELRAALEDRAEHDDRPKIRDVARAALGS